MAGFWGSCGAPLSWQSGFGGGCGGLARHSPATVPSAKWPGGGGSTLKLVLIVVGVLVKGDAALSLDFTQGIGARGKDIALAKTILPRL